MIDLARIKAVGLDLDDTLWPVLPSLVRAEAAMGQWLAPRAPASAALFADTARRLALRQGVVQRQPQLAHDMTALRLQCLREALALHGEDPALAEPAFAVFFEQRLQVEFYADALPALAQLSARYPVVVVSNGNADVGRIGIGVHFHADVSAHRVGIGKPDVRIFHAAACAAGVAPHEVLHVGDDPVLDVLGARDAGMQTVWVNRAGRPWQHAPAPDLQVHSLQELCELLGTVER